MRSPFVVVCLGRRPLGCSAALHTVESFGTIQEILKSIEFIFSVWIIFQFITQVNCHLFRRSLAFYSNDSSSNPSKGNRDNLVLQKILLTFDICIRHNKSLARSCPCFIFIIPHSHPSGFHWVANYNRQTELHLNQQHAGGHHAVFKQYLLGGNKFLGKF